MSSLIGPALRHARVAAALLIASGLVSAPAHAAATGTPDRRAAESPPTLLDDPGEPGTHDVVTTKYRRPSVTLPGLPEKVDVLGYVVRPADATDQSPLVVFVHGQHLACYRPGQTVTKRLEKQWPCRGDQRIVRSYLGYSYLQRLLASQGFVTVSILANAVDAQVSAHADGGASARAALVERHLDQWADWVSAGTYHADIDDVVLVGQGEAGEAVNRLAATTGPSADFAVSGQVLIAPTASGFQTAAHTPTATLLPYCDGLLPDLPGQAYTDIARDASVTPAFHSSALILGANHNFFNTEWTPGLARAPASDDWFGGPKKTCGKTNNGRLSAAEQRDVGSAYVAAAARVFTGVDPEAAALLDGSDPVVPSIGDATVLTHAVGGGRDVRRPGIDAVAGGPTEGATTRVCTGVSGSDADALGCGVGIDSIRTPHWPSTSAVSVPRQSAFELDWSAADQTGGLNFDDPLDLSAASRLDLRTVVDPDVGPVQLSVRLRDGTASATVVPDGGGQLSPLPRGFYSMSKRWAQTLRVPLDSVAGLDLGHIVGITLEAVSPTGHVWVLDVAGVPAALVPPPAAPLPTVSVEGVRHSEGDGPGIQTLAMPFTVEGTVTAPAQFVVAPTITPFGLVPEQVVDLAPGQQGGTIEFDYEADERDGFNYSWPVRIYARSAIMTADWTATATVVDDDPPPDVQVARVASEVREGSPAKFRVSISAPTDYPFVVRMRPVRGPHRLDPVTVGDFSPRLRRKWFGPDIPTLRTPLFKTDAVLLVEVSQQPAGTVVSLATVRTRGRERPKAVAMEFVPRSGPAVSATVTLTD